MAKGGKDDAKSSKSAPKDEAAESGANESQAGGDPTAQDVSDYEYLAS